MKVLFDSQSPCVNFSDLKPGEVFRCPGEEHVYIVCFDEEADPKDFINNAVNLHNGKKRRFCDTVMVERLNAVLHIR